MRGGVKGGDRVGIGVRNEGLGAGWGGDHNK